MDGSGCVLELLDFDLGVGFLDGSKRKPKCTTNVPWVLRVVVRGFHKLIGKGVAYLGRDKA